MATATGELAATELLASQTPAATAGELIESKVPTIETAAYARTAPRLQRNRDVYDGTEAIQARGLPYLPAFKGESATLYDARRTISSVFNGYARTVDAIVGLVCEPEPVLSEDMPETLVTMAESVDGAGQHIAVFTRRLVEAAMVDGFAGVITEYPRANDPRIDRSKASLAATIALATGAELDAADVAALGLRPYFILAKVDEVLPIYESVNGKRTLVLFIRRETATERKGRFGLVTVTRYRVYELIRGQVFYERWTVDGGSAKRDEGPTLMRNLTGIPWSPLALGKKKGEHEYKPTLDDLAFLTLTHHRIATGILSLEEQACVPTPYRVGVPKDSKTQKYPELVLGPSNTIEIPFPPAGVSAPSIPVGYLSPPVDVLNPAMQSLENCKREMATIGAAFLAQQPEAQKTATESAIDAGGEAATVAMISRSVKDCLEMALAFGAMYIKAKPGSVTMNSDFKGIGIQPAYLQVIVSAYQQGALSIEELRHVLQTGQLPEDFEAKDVIDLLAEAKRKQDDIANAAADAAALANDDATGVGA